MFSKKLFKRTIGLICVVCIAYIIYNNYLLIYQFCSSISMIDGEKVLYKKLEKNYDEHLYCIKYFNDLGKSKNYKSIRISRNINDDWEALVYYNYNNEYDRLYKNKFDTIAITDESIIQILDTLEEKCGYYVIDWEKGYISFLSIKGATIDNAMGVLYSFNDNIPKVEDAVELKKLDKPNWYFYYSN